MNFSFLILEFLKKQSSISVSGFGTFYLKNTNAVVDKDEKSILPPGKEIVFHNDYSTRDRDFIKFISELKNIPQIDAEIELKKQVNFWNAHLHKNKELTIENIGTFFLEDSKIHFTGNRTENLSPDFYGLEEINISEIKNYKTGPVNYRFGKSTYWVFPLLIGILALTYFGIIQPEEIFGKKSFKNDTPEKQLPKNEKTPLKKDSLAINNSDSVKTDSPKIAAIPVKTTTKKWNSKKWSSKKYSKSKWKK